MPGGAAQTARRLQPLTEGRLDRIGGGQPRANALARITAASSRAPTTTIGLAGAGGSSVADAGVDDRVEQIDEQVMTTKIVADRSGSSAPPGSCGRKNRVDPTSLPAGHAKIDSGDDCAPEQRADLQPEAPSKQRDRGVLERRAQDDARLAQPWRARCGCIPGPGSRAGSSA